MGSRSNNFLLAFSTGVSYGRFVMTLFDRVEALVARRRANQAPTATHVAFGVAELGELAVEASHAERLEFGEKKTYAGLEIIKVNTQNCLIVGTAMIE